MQLRLSAFVIATKYMITTHDATERYSVLILRSAILEAGSSKNQIHMKQGQKEKN
jgi:hypothetical protein